MMLYPLESSHVALLRPSIFIIQYLVLQNRSLGSLVGTYTGSPAMNIEKGEILNLYNSLNMCITVRP